MNPRIETLTQTHLVGKRLRMSFAANKTRELWQTLMPLVKRFAKRGARPDLYSVEIYDAGFFERFDPAKEFEKWAAIERFVFDSVPVEGLEDLVIPAGIYAVFPHRGTADAAFETYQNIFARWLPASDFLLDERPHFALMGEKYKADAADSEEEIWIPVKPKR